jgi:hypothetical protein
MPRNSKDFTFDADLQLKDAGLIAADDIAQVDGSDKILDFGAARVDGRVVIDATAVEVADGDESFHVVLEFSNSSTFASGIVQGPGFVLGDAAAAAMANADADNGAGRYELPFASEINGTVYRYMRLAVDVAGTVGTGVDFTAYVVKDA